QFRRQLRVGVWDQNRPGLGLASPAPSGIQCRPGECENIALTMAEPICQRYRQAYRGPLRFDGSRLECSDLLNSPELLPLGDAGQLHRGPRIDGINKFLAGRPLPDPTGETASIVRRRMTAFL